MLKNSQKLFFIPLFVGFSFTISNAFSLDTLADNAIHKMNENKNNNNEKLTPVKILNENIKIEKNYDKNNTKKQIFKKPEKKSSIVDKIKHIFISTKSGIKQSRKKSNIVVQEKKIYNKNIKKTNNNIIKLNINEKSAKKIIKNIKSFSKKDIKKIILKIYNIKKEIVKDLNGANYNDLINQLKTVQNLKCVNNDLKENFYTYVFWKILLKFINRNDLYTPKVKEKSFEILSKILSFIDVNKDFNTKFINNIFKLITYARMYNGDQMIYLLNTYYPYGLNNELVFYKLLKIMNSDYIKKNDYVKIYKYLNKNFYNYFNNNSIINFQIINEYFKLLIKFSYEEDFIKSGNQRILNNLIYQNSLNSNLYYYKALYYKYIEDYKKMKKYLLKAIQYNANNNKAWFELISFSFKQRKSFIVKTLKFYKIKNTTLDDLEYNKLPDNAKQTIIKYDNKIIQQIDFYQNNIKTVSKYLNKILLLKANLYFIEGTNFKLANKLFKSANIYYSLKKCNLISNILNIITVINTAESKNYSNKIKNLYQKCINE